MHIFGELVHIFGELVHIFGELVHIFGKLVHIFGKLVVSYFRLETSQNKFREIWGHYGNRGFTMILDLAPQVAWQQPRCACLPVDACTVLGEVRLHLRPSLRCATLIGVSDTYSFYVPRWVLRWGHVLQALML